MHIGHAKQSKSVGSLISKCQVMARNSNAFAGALIELKYIIDVIVAGTEISTMVCIGGYEKRPYSFKLVTTCV